MYPLGLTGSRDGCLLIENHEIRNLLIDNLSHHCEIICQTACLSLVNVSSTESGANSLLNCQGKNKVLVEFCNQHENNYIIYLSRIRIFFPLLRLKLIVKNYDLR